MRAQVASPSSQRTKWRAMANRTPAAEMCMIQIGPCVHCGWTGPKRRYSLGDYRGCVEARAAAEKERAEHRCEELISAEQANESLSVSS